MDREIPSVPITTLAGIASVTDLLPEMPLPTPLPQTLSNKSLLFHPRVAEEAQNLLKTRDELLMLQLVDALKQTSADHIEVKDNFVCTETSVDQHEGIPDLLQAMIETSPNVFRGKGEYNNIPVIEQEVEPLPILDLKSPNKRPTEVMESYKSIPQVVSTPPTTAPLESLFNDRTLSEPEENTNSIDHEEEDEHESIFSKSTIKLSPNSSRTTTTTLSAGSATELRLQRRPQKESSSTHKLNDLHNSGQTNIDNTTMATIKQPVVRLQRISSEDQILMQKSLTNFIENKPKLAKELGIVANNRIKEPKSRYIEESSEDENESFQEEEPKKKRTKKGEEEDDYVPDKFSALVGTRKRKSDTIEITEAVVKKPKLRKVEKKFGPVLQKLSFDELMETNTYSRFSKSMDYVIKFYSGIDVSDIAEDGIIPDEHLLNRHVVQELCTEAAKLNSFNAMDMIPSDKLVKLLNALEITIRGADRVSPITDEDIESMRQIWMETAMERVLGAADACLTCLHILTARNMPKRVYIEEVIDRVVLYIKYQMNNTIFPSYDVTYRSDSKKKDGRRKKSAHVLEKSVQNLFVKILELVQLLAKLLDIQVLTDTSVLHASSMGVSPFFTENVSDLQLACLKLVTTIFTKYDKHRKLLLDDILASIARLPSTKRSLRTYRLNSNENIQMLTALVLQLIQCIVVLPESLCQSKKEREKEKEQGQPVKRIDKDVLISSKNMEVMSTAGTFLSAFLSKCGNKSEEIDYRPLFENFVQDLLATVNKPEWPATELVLTLLGKLLVTNFTNKCTEMSLRVASLDYLGVIAARLRRDSVLSRCKVNTIDQMIKDIKLEELKETDGNVNKNKLDVKSDEERIQFLQKVLLDFLAVKAQTDEAYKFARHFYIVQWYKECNTEKSLLTSRAENDTKNNAKDHHKNRKSINDDDENSDDEIENHKAPEEVNADKIRELEDRKKVLISQIKAFKEKVNAGNRIKVFETYIGYDSAELIAQYLASKRHFSQCFHSYLKSILTVLKESSIAIRTKAMKCLTLIVEADPSVLGRHDMQLGVQFSFHDSSTSVREAAVDLVGKFVLNRPELINKYYDMLSARILDTGVSVRKRVIKILKDICIECPEFPKIPEICVKMIRRVNDEEGIRKLVMEVFQNMWFTTTNEDSQLLRKVMNITEVVASCKDIGLEWFEQLLVSLFKPKEDKDDSTKINTEPPKALLTACTQIVDCLIQNVLKFEESTDSNGSGTSPRILACLTTLYLFAKIRPKLLVSHAITLQPYLSLKCGSVDDTLIITRVAKMLELVVPLMEHPSESFLAQLEEDSMKLILQYDRNIVASCVACLGAIINKVTKNYKLMRDCFTKYYSFLEKYHVLMQNPEKKDILTRSACRSYLRRSLFTVGLILRHFDFKNPKVHGEDMFNVKDKIYMLMDFLEIDEEDIQRNTMMAIGSICIRHYEFMLEDKLKKFYHNILVNDDCSIRMKAQTLANIQMYLVEEETRMIQQDLEWSKNSKQENLKEMGDVSSGMASTIIQLYLKEILQSYLHIDVSIRTTAMQVISIVLQQGLVHPVQIVPYLICMSTDSVVQISNTADKQLQEIEKKYPGFIHTKASLGIRLSYELQIILQGEDIVRGFKVKEKGDYPSALNGYLYSLLRSSRQQRRALVLNILKQFDDQVRTSLSYMLYLADDLAYFPYQVQDEPLFIVHHIDIMISVTGTNLLQTFREGLINPDAQRMPNVGANVGQPAPISALDEDDDDEDILAERVPEDVTHLQASLTAAQGCLLLLMLKQHLKDVYGLSDGKIQQYSPSEPAKVYEKTANRKSNALFQPKATVNKIKQGEPPMYLDYEGRKDLIRQYLDFKNLMLQLDPDDGDEDENNKSTNLANININSSLQLGNVTASTATPILTEADQVVLSNYKDTPPKVPKLVISNRSSRMDSDTKRTPRQRNTDKNKKHKPKKKRKKIASSSGDESDFSDPDFMA